MFRTSYFKKFLLPGGTYAATAITSGEGQDVTQERQGVTGQDQKKEKGSSGDNCNPCTGKALRRTDLPLYNESSPVKEPCDEAPGTLEQGISAVRKELWVWHDKYKGYQEKVKDVVITGKEHSAVLIDQLRKDELPVPRSGAIAIGGLAGVVLGLRGGWFKRIIYGSTCAGLMAAVCYPKEVAEISEETLETTKKYVLITYNFIYGVKPESLKLPSPSQLLGNHVETPDKGKGNMKTSVPAVSEGEPETSVRVLKSPQDYPSDPEIQEPEPTIPEPTIPEPTIPEEPSCDCHLTPGHICSAHGHEKVEQGPSFGSSFRSHFDRFAEESADVVYWGFRLRNL